MNSLQKNTFRRPQRRGSAIGLLSQDDEDVQFNNERKYANKSTGNYLEKIRQSMENVQQTFEESKTIFDQWNLPTATTTTTTTPTAMTTSSTTGQSPDGSASGGGPGKNNKGDSSLKTRKETNDGVENKVLRMSVVTYYHILHSIASFITNCDNGRVAHCCAKR